LWHVEIVLWRLEAACVVQCVRLDYCPLNIRWPVLALEFYRCDSAGILVLDLCAAYLVSDQDVIDFTTFMPFFELFLTVW